MHARVYETRWIARCESRSTYEDPFAFITEEPGLELALQADAIARSEPAGLTTGVEREEACGRTVNEESERRGDAHGCCA